MSGFKWTVPPQKEWPKGAAAYAKAIRRGVHGVMQRWAPEIENWMKAGAPWTDRTSNARQALYAVVDPPTSAQVVALIELVMAQGMLYGAYLEGFDPRYNFAPTQQGQKYAIVMPALDHFGPLIWADIKKMLS